MTYIVGKSEFETLQQQSPWGIKEYRLSNGSVFFVTLIENIDYTNDIYIYNPSGISNERIIEYFYSLYI